MTEPSGIQRNPVTLLKRTVLGRRKLIERIISLRPLKLHIKTTILVSLVILAVLVIVTLFYYTQAKAIYRDEQKQRAENIALGLADSITQKELNNNLADLDALATSNLIRGVVQVRIYALTRGVPLEVVTEPATEKQTLPERVVESIKESTRNPGSYSDLYQLSNGDVQVDAYARINTEEGWVGIVMIQWRTDTPLLRQLTRIIVTLLLAAIVIVTVLTFLFFRRIIYRPIDELLSAMVQAQSGDLSVTAPERADDEIGHLARGFNRMLERIRSMTDERDRLNLRLQERVLEATAEVAERNEQLESANLELFKIQHLLSQYERLAIAGQLTAQFAHEVGTPLNLISGHVQLLRSRVEDERTKQRLDVITTQIDRITRIVRGMLDTTRRPKPIMTPVNLNALLQRTFEAAAPTLASNNVSLATEFDPDLPEVFADPEQMQQVFINLLNNSLDAMPEGGELILRTSTTNGEVTVECVDTGEGMTAEVQAHVFEPLFTTKVQGRGTGLGLSIVKQIISEHSGQIEIISTPGAGTRLIITLPLQQASTNPTIGDKQHPIEIGS